jgi:hypothetical protein
VPLGRQRCGRNMEEWYKEDLAFIHDIGFGDFARKSAPGILEILDRQRLSEDSVEWAFGSE